MAGITQNRAGQGKQWDRYVQRFVDDAETADEGIVESMDPATRELTVRFKHRPGVSAVRGVQPLDEDGDWVELKPYFRGMQGLLISTRQDGSNRRGVTRVTRAASPGKHEGVTWFFMAGNRPFREVPLPLVYDPNAGPDDDVAGPDDVLKYHAPSGAHIIIKKNGRTIIRGFDVFIGGLEGPLSSFKAVAREGDSVNLLTGKISSGSGSLKASD